MGKAGMWAVDRYRSLRRLCGKPPVPAKRIRRIRKLYPAGKPEEIGDVIVCMCSDRFGYMTGAVVSVDGGKNTVEDSDLPWVSPWKEVN